MANPSWEKRNRVRFFMLYAHLADPNTEGDKLLAAESISREQRRTLKLHEERGKSSVPRLLMSAIVRAEFPTELISAELIVLFDLPQKYGSA